MKYLLGIDIGGTKCAVALGVVERELSIIDKISFPTETGKGVEYSLGQILQSLREICARNGIEIARVNGIGVSCGGPLDSRKGLILSPPNLPGWNEVPIVDWLEKETGIPARLQNDANACALAEWRFGAARGYRNAIFLTFGTGMGAGLILNGQLYSGTNDMAGEIGHMRMREYGPVGYGKAGAFEGFCSGGGIAQLARMKVMEKLQQGESVGFCPTMQQLEKLNARLVAEAAQSGDPLAEEIYRISGEHLGRGLAVLIDLLNPEIIVIGSIFTRCRELLWPAALKALKEESLSYSREVCRVVPAQLGEEIGDYAALAAAVDLLPV